MFEYTAHKVKNSIIISNICYFESQGRTIVIHTITNQYTFYGKLSNLLDNESLSDFISIHKSYLVNKNYIERFTSHSVVLIGIDRVELPISPNKKMEVSEQLLKEWYDYFILFVFKCVSHICHLSVFQCVFTKEKESAKSDIVLFTLYYIINSCAYLLFDNRLITILSNIIPFILIFLYYKVSLFKSLLSAFVLCVFPL